MTIERKKFDFLKYHSRNSIHPGVIVGHRSGHSCLLKKREKKIEKKIEKKSCRTEARAGEGTERLEKKGSS